MDCKTFPGGPQLWKSVFLCGTELEQLSQVHSIKWDFSHLDKELQTGCLSVGKSQRKHIYMFGQTEPQMIPDGDQTTVVPIPVVISVETDVALPAKLGLNSVQMEKEKLVDMSEYKMEWVPMEVPNAPKEDAENKAPQATRGKRKKRDDYGRFWSLDCKQRSGRGTLKNLKEERTRMFDYCMPYILLPHKQEQEGGEQDTSVDVMIDIPGRQAPLVCEFDWTFDELDEFVDEKMEQEELEAQHREVLMKGVQDAVAAAKKARKDAKAAKRAEIEAIPEADRTALKNIRVHKFYPLNELCASMQSRYVNRYYGQADEVHPKPMPPSLPTFQNA